MMNRINHLSNSKCSNVKYWLVSYLNLLFCMEGVLEDIVLSNVPGSICFRAERNIYC